MLNGTPRCNHLLQSEFFFITSCKKICVQGGPIKRDDLNAPESLSLLEFIDKNTSTSCLHG